jgi:hypothetical protein
MRSVAVAIVVAFGASALVAGVARAEVSEAEPRSDDEFDFMNLHRCAFVARRRTIS